jgi:hypothetical protein
LLRRDRVCSPKDGSAGRLTPPPSGAELYIQKKRFKNRDAEQSSYPKTNDDQNGPASSAIYVEKLKIDVTISTDHFERRQMHWNELVGFAAALAVLTSFCMSSITALRSFAILSNVLFITYGAIGSVYPVLFLHAVLLPVNLIKLHQTVCLHRCLPSLIELLSSRTSTRLKSINRFRWS